jgi:bacterioferritin-associated ferredoxin
VKRVELPAGWERAGATLVEIDRAFTLAYDIDTHGTVAAVCAKCIRCVATLLAESRS